MDVMLCYGWRCARGGRELVAAVSPFRASVLRHPLVGQAPRARVLPEDDAEVRLQAGRRQEVEVGVARSRQHGVEVAVPLLLLARPPADLLDHLLGPDVPDEDGPVL